MIDFLRKLFDTTDFPARWSCGQWTQGHGWLHVLSDLATFGAYTAIPIVLLAFVRRRPDVPFPRVFWLFGLFIFSCGTVHLIEAGIFWWPAYRLSGTVKLVTALASWATVAALVPVVPKALALPGLAKVNAELQREVLERQLAEERFRQTIEASPNAMLLVDAEGKLVQVNAQAEVYFGYERAELVGRPITDLVPPSLRPFHPDLVARFMRDPKVLVLGADRGVRAVRKDGSEFPVEIGLNPIRTREGTYALATITDISERKRAEDELRRRTEELERSNRELDDFAYVASHDLREPLRGIHNYASFLLEDYEHLFDEDGRAKLQALPRLSRRLDGLIDSLLHFSRVGRMETAFQDVDLDAVVRGVVDTLHVALAERGVEVRLPRPLPRLRCDRSRVAEVFRNLISNASKYTVAAEKWVEVGYREPEEGGAPVFHVRDNGIGIPQRHHEAIFRIFKRLHARDEYGGGTGAGLTIVKKIVELHGGRIWLESQPGEGTTFYFTLSH